jgi:dynein heavy chain
MTNLPQELEKMREDITDTIDIYEVLEEFDYKFSKEDMNKRWVIFGGPRDALEMMNARKKTLEKDQTKFMDEMKLGQDEFKQTLDNLERTIQNFH